MAPAQSLGTQPSRHLALQPVPRARLGLTARSVVPAGGEPPATMSPGRASAPQDGGVYSVIMVSPQLCQHWEPTGRWGWVLYSVSPQGLLWPQAPPIPARAFLQPAPMAGLERPAPSAASAHLVLPATTSLGSVAVPQALLGLAVSRVGDRAGWALGQWVAQPLLMWPEAQIACSSELCLKTSCQGGHGGNSGGTCFRVGQD